MEIRGNISKVLGIKLAMQQALNKCLLKLDQQLIVLLLSLSFQLSPVPFISGRLSDSFFQRPIYFAIIQEWWGRRTSLNVTWGSRFELRPWLSRPPLHVTFPGLCIVPSLIDQHWALSIPACHCPLSLSQHSGGIISSVCCHLTQGHTLVTHIAMPP